MQRQPVDSTTFISIGYDAAKCELDLEYRTSGKVYRYFDVPLEEYTAFMAAESKGEYLNEVFKLRGYRYEMVEDHDDPPVLKKRN